MVGLRKRGESIRQFILDNVENHPTDITQLTAQAFEISRQAVLKHIRMLIEQKGLLALGSTKDRRYALRPLVKWEQIYSLTDNLKEDTVWRQDIEPLIGKLPDNVINIWHYGFTEMLNNAIDHSLGQQVTVQVFKTPNTTEIIIYDNGEGVFKKIQREFDLEDERHAVLELAKGKLTTDPSNHTGEGIFFSSRIFDHFFILSGNTCFSHQYNEVEDWILDRRQFQSGTGVFMKLQNNTSRILKKIFDQFTSGDDYGFTKTVLPVSLAQYGDEVLISRSQAKRLLDRIDRFQTVVLDFERIESIGQAFADQVFRVFAKQHPGIKLVYINAKKPVEQMIKRARQA